PILESRLTAPAVALIFSDGMDTDPQDPATGLDLAASMVPITARSARGPAHGRGSPLGAGWRNLRREGDTSLKRERRNVVAKLRSRFRLVSNGAAFRVDCFSAG